MHRNYGSEIRPVCGYDSCPCRGVHFISCYRQESDYCVDGERVAVSEETGAIRKATALQIEKMVEFYGSERQKYEEWYARMAPKYGDYLSPISEPKPMPHLKPLAA
jgi:hypothetical protein